jgi:SAM-dependent methyltransferase
MPFNKKNVWSVLEFPKNLFPTKYRIFADPATFHINRMMNMIPIGEPGMIALDCGAGPQGKKALIQSKFYNYESSDFEDIFDKNSLVKQTYICNVENMPINSDRFDLIISVQVLEHVEHPLPAIKEMARVLKQGKLIFLSTNFLYPRHGEPYDFFRFTENGLRLLANEAGLEVESIVAHGGFWAVVAQFFHELPLYFRNFLIFGSSHPVSSDHPLKSRIPFVLILYIPIFCLNAVTQLLSFVFHSLDRLDSRQRYTLGYSLILRKI